jgi:hypothetical protein
MPFSHIKCPGFLENPQIAVYIWGKFRMIPKKMLADLDLNRE